MWKLVLAYDGGEFHGWQIQPDQPTVQGLLRDALLRITGEDVLPQGSGPNRRRSACPGPGGIVCPGGSHSRNESCPSAESRFAGVYPRAQRQQGGNDFHARHSAQAKTYEYRIFRGEICPPWRARYVYALNARWMWMRCSARRPGFWVCMTSLPLPPAIPIRADHVRCLHASAVDRAEEDQSASLSCARQWLPASHGAESGGNLSRSGTREC